MIILWLLLLMVVSFVGRSLSPKPYLSKAIGIAVLTYIVWVFANFMPFKFASIVGFLTYLLIFAPKVRRDGIKEWVRFEIVFLLTFLAYLIYVSFDPWIFGGEKMMDVGVLTGILRSTGMPPIDVNLAGFTFDCYYYMGYVIVAVLTALTGTSIGIAYNLGLATFFALTLSMAIEFAADKGFRTLPFFLLAGNLASFVILLGSIFHATSPTKAFDFWTVTRVIPGTINEFPFATFTFRDLHPHLMDIPFQVAFLILLYEFWIHRDKKLIAILSFLLGFMGSVNSWELPTYLFLLILSLRNSGDLKYMLFLLPFLPYMLKLHPHAVKGIGIVTSRTPLLRFIIAQPLVLIPLLFVLSRNRRLMLASLIAIPIAVAFDFQILPLLLPILVFSLFDFEEFENVLLFVVILLLLLVEIFYVNDPYPQKIERLNTVFKTYVQAWILLSFVSAIIYENMKRKHLILLFLAILWIYPVGFLATHHSWKGTIDGMAYTDGEYNALKFLQNCPNGVVLEYPGKSPFSSYTYTGRVSAFTGLQAVFVRGGHELFWRYYSEYDGKPWWIYLYERWKETNRMFEAKDIGEILPLLKKYHVRYIFIGKLEREHYSEESLRKFDVFKLIYSDGNVKVYEVTFLNETSRLVSR